MDKTASSLALVSYKISSIRGGFSPAVILVCCESIKYSVTPELRPSLLVCHVFLSFANIWSIHALFSYFLCLDFNKFSALIFFI